MQRRCGPWNPEKISESRDDDSGLLGKPDGSINVFRSGDAYGTSRTADKLNIRGKKLSESRSKDRNSVRTTYFHESYGLFAPVLDSQEEFSCKLRITVFVEMLDGHSSFSLTS
jgi:hypothetical protein